MISSVFYPVFLGLYFTLLIFFSFVTHPIGYCILLICASMCVSMFSFLYFGFSWYLALFILVYVGGVYVLFVFVSLQSPNSFSSFGGNSLLFFFILLLLSALMFYSGVPLYAIFDTSHYLCSYMEGFSYLLLCFSLLVGLVGVSVVSSRKDSFFR